MIEIDYATKYHEKQKQIFEDGHKYKVIQKGRRFGLTHGMAKYVIEKMLCAEGPVIWIDTIHSNIKKYIERYFMPELKRIDKRFWKYNKTELQLTLMNQNCDFRSADKPENMEGFGYKTMIINEAGIVLKNRELWLQSLLPMIMDYDAEVIIGGTPKGKKTKDKQTHLFYELSLMEKENKKYKTFHFTTYDNPLLNKEIIKEVEEQIPKYLREQEIQGQFIDKTISGIIKPEWWNYIDEDDIYKEKWIKKVQMWDTAFKAGQENDFTVCETWLITKNKYILLNVFRDRLEFPELKKAAIDLHQQYNPNEVWIEDKASGISLIQELKRETRIPIKQIKADKDKLEYINSITPLIEQGKVYLVKNKTWLPDFTDECEDYPDVEFDDQIDTMAKFLNEAKNTITERTPAIRTKKIIRTKYKGYRR